MKEQLLKALKEGEVFVCIKLAVYLLLYIEGEEALVMDQDGDEFFVPVSQIDAIM